MTAEGEAEPHDPRLDRLAEVLHLILEFCDLSRSELAARMGGDYTIRRILSQPTALRIDQLLAFADAVGLRPIEILGLAFGDADAAPGPLLQRVEQQSRRLTAVLDRLKSARSSRSCPASVAPASPPPRAGDGDDRR
jgi:hypothetical protein